ncbi:hypothetical protein DFS34DRAFT_271068 [Phlyctochytrium arcticum]|nr:hypothetical protein DFS34DRAFT_271068 [Phlyctochytrium arcticum]
MHIQELHLIPSCTLDAELLRLWLDVMHHLPALKKLSLSITAVSGSAAGMLRTLVSETSATECQCLLKCSDATAVGNLLRLAHNTEPGLSNISALPSPNTKTGWPAMIPAARIVVADTPARMTDTPTSNDTHTTLHLTLQHAVDAMSWEKAAVIINSLSTVSKITGLGIHRWHSFTEQIVLELLTSIMSRKCHLVHIAVPGLNLGALQVAAFCDGLKCASSIQSLDLSGNIRQNDESALLAASSLGQLLSSARSKITKILLAGNFFTSRGLNVIFAAIKSNRDLRHLGISHMDLNSSLLALGETLVSRVATLDFLDVSSSSLLPRTIRDFACFLEETEDARLSISELRMDGLHFIQTVPQSINSLLPRCCTSLKRLSLEGSNDDASDRALGDIGMSTITSALAELHCLLYLSLARQQLSDKSIKCVLDVIKATGVKRVKMGHNRIGTRGLKVLVEGLRCLLTAESDHVIVDLEQNFIPKEALRYPGGVLNEKHYTVMLMRQRI